ncbi:hypothetical protein E5161_04035 [Cohnella pontilimi]|uniref:DUF7660 domain-containing protein n=1 Tax=Cohnella pontilimi TaxID=2564100 RepID=A0A4U0FFC6_9BACL|nr:hypothetical protein [Cohnella pontilimi]TJY43074.1 hypothetical protein E5161_04035 [Cohnella pontilimi]
MKKTLFELVNDVTDEITFLNFINELHKDRLENSDWENNSIESFLEAIHDWGKASINGLEFYEKPDNSWKRCAQILYMGKIYE